MRHCGQIRSLQSAIIASLATMLMGCTVARITPPTDFVALRDPPGYDFKAVSARGNVFAMTARDNPNKDAGLQFWTQAVEHHKVDLDGYRLTARQEIKTQSGMPGTLFDLRAGVGAAEYTYLLALFVTPRQIYTIESAGPTAQLAPDLSRIRDAILTLRP